MAGRQANLAVVTAVAVIAALAPAWGAAQVDVDAKRSRLPAAVAKAIDANCPGAEIDKLEVENEAGIKLYDVEFKAGKGEIEVAEDGTVLNVATIIPLEDVPEPVAAVIRKAAGDAFVRAVERSEVRARVDKSAGKGRLVPVTPPEYEYEAELVKGGEIEVAADGKVIKGSEAEGREPPKHSEPTTRPRGGLNSP
jgi:hypothetical protein